MAAARTMVRMAEHAASREVGATLVTLGLGSCIGCALIDASAGVAGLAHIVLPESWTRGPGEGAAPPGKFADTAVPTLLREVLRLGARESRLRAVICGGAHMFGTSGASPLLEIGRRNDEETRRALSAARIQLRAADTGGSNGRSIEVHVASGEVFVRVAGREPVAL
jgi:chemotaxis protein CheD